MPHKDKYRSYEELSTFEEEGDDYQVEVISGQGRSSEIVIIAPHRGGIEKHTSKIARNIAGKEFGLYLFEGTNQKCNFATLHITSTRFDEPRCVKIVEQSQTAVAVHGKSGKKKAVLVGGRDDDLAEQMITELENAGFAASREESGPVSGTSPQNICNRTISNTGIQLEIYRGLRDDLDGSESLLIKFGHSIRKVLLEHQRAIDKSNS
jgi:phage replication-related protein YjqB (UPF0714/DUF867 family)